MCENDFAVGINLKSGFTSVHDYAFKAQKGFTPVHESAFKAQKRICTRARIRFQCTKKDLRLCANPLSKHKKDLRLCANPLSKHKKGFVPVHKSAFITQNGFVPAPNPQTAQEWRIRLMADSNYKFAPPCRENAPEWRTFMVLFKMELYKICHKKIFALGVICIPVFVLLSFFLNLHDTIWFGETGTLSGWVCFTGTYSVGMILTSILILCLISPVFAGEAHTRMKSISFTTREGPAKDAHAKLAASFTVSVGLWFMTSVFTLLPYLIGCGLDTLSHTAGPVMGWNADANFAVLTQPFGVYLADVVLLGLFAAAQLCAITLCISAHARSPFYVVCTAALCWIAPRFGLLVMHGC